MKNKKLVMVSVTFKGRRTTKFLYIPANDDNSITVSEDNLPLPSGIMRGQTYTPS